MPNHPDEQLARLKSLNAVYQALSTVELSAFSLPLLLQIVLETGTKLTGAKYGALGVFDESGTRLTEFITMGLDEETKKRIGTLPVGLGLLGAMTDEPGALRFRDLSQHPKSIGFPPHHPSMKSFLGISIRAHGKIYGRLYLTDKQDAEEFLEVDAEIVTVLAAQAGTILERGLLIEQFKSAEAKHRQILESAAEGIYGLDLDGICTFINKAGAAMLGYRPEELIDRRMHSLVHHTRPDGLPYPEEECPTERSRRHGRPSHLIEDIYWRKDGTSFPVQLSCAPLVRDGALLGAVVTFFDITERKQAEIRKVLDYSITQALIESTTVDETNQKVLQVVCGVLGWEWSAVWEVDKQANVLRPMMIWHKPEFAASEFEAITSRMTFAPGVGLPGRVWSTGEPAYIPDVTRDQNFPRAPSATQAGLRRGFAFPVQLSGDIIGIMEFFSRELREPSRDVMDLLDTLGSQIGLQIERKRAEEGLKLFRILLDNVKDSIEVIDPQTGRFIDGNEKASSNLGYTRTELFSLTVSDIDPLVTGSVFTKYVQRLRETGEPLTLGSVHRRKDGTTFPVEVSAQLIQHDKKKEYVVAIVRDITERKRAEAAIQQAKELSEGIINSSVDGILAFDCNCHYTVWNLGMELISGIGKEQTLGKCAFDVFPFLKQIGEDKYLFETLAGKTVVAKDRPYVVPETGRQGFFEGHYSPLYGKSGEIIGGLAIIREITERKRAEAALRQVQARLQQAQEEERKRIAREIHDELGQQLTMLRFGLVKLAEMEKQPPPELRKKARALTKPVDTMIDTVRRIATALRPSILDDLGLAAALEWLITDFRAKTDIPCDVALAPPPDDLDDTRSITLFRTLQEALTNIARHAQATRVTIRLQQAGGILVLEVEDNGRGLTEAQRTSPAAIGLFGMQERALLVGGTVTIQSRPGKGTTVTARIPIR